MSSRRFGPLPLAAFAALVVIPATAAAMIPTDHFVRLKTELHGLDVGVQTSAREVALARLENRSDKTLFCSVGFFHGFDLRRRTDAAIAPGASRLFTYPLREVVSTVPIEVVCDLRREALPRRYL